MGVRRRAVAIQRLDNTSFAMRLHFARQQAGLTVEQCANRVGVSVEQWDAWEAGKMPRAIEAGLAAKALGVDYHWLVFGETLQQKVG